MQTNEGPSLPPDTSRRVRRHLPAINMQRVTSNVAGHVGGDGLRWPEARASRGGCTSVSSRFVLCQREEKAAKAESKQEMAITLFYRDSYRYADGRRSKIGHWRQGAMSAYISIHLRCARVKWIVHCIGPTSSMSPEIGFLADEMKLTSRRHIHIAILAQKGSTLSWCLARLRCALEKEKILDI